MNNLFLFWKQIVRHSRTFWTAVPPVQSSYVNGYRGEILLGIKSAWVTEDLDSVDAVVIDAAHVLLSVWFHQSFVARILLLRNCLVPPLFWSLS